MARRTSNLAAQKDLALSPEEVWIREFVAFYGTDGVCRFLHQELSGVSATRILEALTLGRMIWVDKADIEGTECLIRHLSEDNTVDVTVSFNSVEMRLTVLRAQYCGERFDGQDAA